MILGVALAALSACSSPPPPCERLDQTVVDGGPSCAAIAPVEDAVEHLAGRPLPDAERRALYAALADDWQADPDGFPRRVAGWSDVRDRLAALEGLRGAVERGRMVYENLHGDGAFAHGNESVRTILGRAVSEWARDDGDHIVLAESDIEGFLRYASLCREVQSGGPLRLALSDRGGLYQALIARFRGGTTADREAVLGIGAGFWAARRAWIEASYDRQQEFARGAPLPPPMNATSLAYAEAIVAGDLPAHAANLHATLGPLAITPAEDP